MTQKKAAKSSTPKKPAPVNTHLGALDKPVMVYLPEMLKERLKKAATQQAIGLSAFIRMSVQRHCNEVLGIEK